MTRVIRSVVTGVGGYLPDEIVTNEELPAIPIDGPLEPIAYT